MKKIVFCILMLIPFFSIADAQERVDKVPASLTYKSEEIRKALYWHQSSKTGKWKSRKCSQLAYLGEGVDVENFHSMYIGKYEDQNYLFLDKRIYHWRYANIEREWMYTRTMHAALLSDNDIHRLDSISVGECYVFVPAFVNDMSMASEEYSFPLFLELTESLRSVNDNKNTDAFMVVKRVKTSGGDFVRFRFGPVTELIDSFYFEIPYKDYRRLFVSDQNKNYKP